MHPSPRMLIALWPAAALVAAALLTSPASFAGAPTPTPAAPPGVPVERVIPASQNVSLDQATFQVDITVEAVSNLGAYEVLLTFDSAAVAFVSAADGPFLGSTGRATSCTNPVVQTLPGTLRKLQYGCGTFGAPPPPGASGAGVLATLQFAPLATGLTPLVLEPSLSDPFGTDIPAFAYSGSADIQPGPTATPTQTFTPTPSPTPCPGGVCPTPTPVQCAPSSVSIASGLYGSPYVALGVPVQVANVCDLGAFEFTVAYDAALLSFSGFSPGPFASSTGRPIECLPPSNAPGSVLIRCATLGGAPPGASGSGNLGTLQFVPLAEGTSALDVQSVTLLEPDAGTIPASASDGSVTIGPCTGACSTVTPTATPSPTPMPTDTPIPTPTYTSTPCGGPCPTPTNTPAFVPPTNTPTPAIQPVTLRVEPVAGTALEGSQLTADVRIENAVNTGAFGFTMTWDSAVLTFQSVTAGPFLGSTGRSTFCNLDALTATSVRFSCGSLGAQLPGASGAGTLAQVVFSATGAGTSPLVLNNPQVTTPSAQLVPVAAVFDGAVTVAACGTSCPTPTNTPATSPTATPPITGAAVVGTAPQNVTVAPGDTFSVDVTVSSVANLGAFEFVFDYNDSQPFFLELVSVNPGTFLGSTGRPVVCQPPNVTVLTVRYGCASLGSGAGPSGSGTLATLTFRAVDFGIMPLFGVSAAELTTPLADPIVTVLAARGTVSAQPPTPTPTPTLAGGGGGGFTQTSGGRDRDGGDGGNNVAAAGATMLFGAAVIFIGGRRVPARVRAGAAALGTGVAVLLVVVLSPPAPQAAGGATIAVSPASANLFVGGPPLTVQIAAGDVPAPGAAAFDLRLRFDSNLVDVTLAPGPMLGSTGRSVTCSTSPMGYFEVAYSCATSGVQPAPTGSGVLANVTIAPKPQVDVALRAAAVNGGVLALQIAPAGTQLRTQSGAALPLMQLGEGAIAIRALEGDVNKDCAIDLADVQQMVSRYASSFGDVLYQSQYDVEPQMPDSDVDIRDVQFVYGRLGSTCASPLPAQPPSPPSPPADTDGDGFSDALDNCGTVANPAQEDADADLLGDVCEAAFGTSPSDADSDDDGCADGPEARTALYDRTRGGDRNPIDRFDFADVPVPALPAAGARNRVISIADVIAVLPWIGTVDGGAPNAAGNDYDADANANGVDDGAEYDRRASAIAGKPWRAGAPNGSVTISDALVVLTSVGDRCDQ